MGRWPERPEGPKQVLCSRPILYARLASSALFSTTPPMEILRNIARHKLRSLLTISGILIGVLALTTMGALAENFNALLDGGVKYFGSNIIVGPPDGQSASLLATSKIDEIKQVPGVAAAFPAYQFSVKPGQITTVSFGIPDTIIAGDPVENTMSALKTTCAQGHSLD